ncbi:hypothetical protein [Lentzea nigeriaca]|nr:hypothetical protein [Lentzea nigeriaca]MBM7864452.1 hypothetical protein [Lentzea nigeriaca]
MYVRPEYLHTYRHSPGALDLWRALGKQLWEEEDGVVHFEIAMH